MSELKKCPFCGGERIISTYNNFVPALLCGSCGSMMTIPWDLNENIEEELQKKWNTRKPMDKIVERLEAMKMRYFLTIANTGDKKLDAVYEGVGNAIDKAIEIIKEEGQMEC